MLVMSNLMASSCNCQIPSCSNCGLCHLCDTTCNCADQNSDTQPQLRKRRRQTPTTPPSAIDPKSNHTNSNHDPQRDRLRTIFRTLGIDARALSRLHINNTDHSRALRSAHAIMQKIIHAVAPLVYPSDPSLFIAAYPEPGTSHKTGQEKLLQAVISAMKATRRGTIARRYVRSILCGKMTRSQVNELLGNLIDNNHHQLDDDDNIDDDDNDNDNDDDDNDEIQTTKKNKQDDDILTVSGKTFSRARRDYDMLIQCGELQLAKYGRSKIQDNSLTRLLTFLYSPTNVMLLSWTAQRLMVEEKKLHIPALVTSKTGSQLHQDYCKHLESLGQNPLSRGSFYSVLNTLTRREIKRTLPLDNATRILVKEPLILVRDVIVRLIPYPDRTHFLKEIDKTEWFLIHSLEQSHLGSDKSGLHDLTFALTAPQFDDQHLDDQSRATHCKGCIYPFLVLEEIRRTSPFGDREAVAELTNDCRNKFIYYLSYLCQKTIQCSAIENAAQEIVTKKLHNRVIICMSYFQGDELSRTDESTNVPCLTGNLIYGCAVFHLDANDNVDGKNIDLKPRFYNHLIDSKEVTSQFFVTTSVIEALLHRIRDDIPQAEEIIFVSDGIRAYKNELFLKYLPFLCHRLHFRAVRFLFSCCQISEFLCRAHFNGVVRQVKQDLLDLTLTPERLVNLVGNDSSLSTTCIELLSLNPQSETIWKQIERNINHNSVVLLGSANDIFYQYEQNQLSLDASRQNKTIIAHSFSFAGTSKAQIIELSDNISAIFEQFGPQPNSSDTKFDTTSAVSIVPPGLEISPSLDEVGLTSITTSKENRNDVANTISDDRSNQRRSGEVSAKWTGRISGVHVIASSWKNKKGNMYLAQLPNNVTEGVLIDTISRLQVGTLQMCATKSESIGVEEQMNESAISNRVCSDCGRSFKSFRFLRSHSCKGPPGDKDVSARAVYLACQMYERNELPIFVDHSEQIWAGSVFAADATSRPITGLTPGWALERRLDELVEMEKCLKYRDEAFLWLESHEEEGSNSVVSLYSYLQRRYGNVVDLPSVEVIEIWKNIYEASNRIRPYIQASGDGIAMVTTSEDTERNVGRSRMKAKYVEKITELHKQELARDEASRCKPRHLFQQFEEFFKDEHGCVPPDFPDHKQVMNKINALRSKSKQKDVY